MAQVQINRASITLVNMFDQKHIDGLAATVSGEVKLGTPIMFRQKEVGRNFVLTFEDAAAHVALLNLNITGKVYAKNRHGTQRTVLFTKQADLVATLKSHAAFMTVGHANQDGQITSQALTVEQAINAPAGSAAASVAQAILIQQATIAIEQLNISK